MAGQGSINMPGYQPAQMGAVLDALKAVHEFYGIDTEKAQQKALDLDTQLKQQTLDLNKQKMGAVQAFMQKYSQPQSQQDASQAQNQSLTPNQSSPQQSQGPDFEKMREEAAGNPFLAEMFEPSIKATNEIREDKRKTNAEAEGAVKDARGDENFKQMQDSLLSSRKLYNMLASGNPVDEDAAKTLYAKIALGANKISGFLDEKTAPKAVVNNLMNLFNQKVTGKDLELNRERIRQGAELQEKFSSQALDKIAQNYAQAAFDNHGNTTGLSTQDFYDRILPNGPNGDLPDRAQWKKSSDVSDMAMNAGSKLHQWMSSQKGSQKSATPVLPGMDAILQERARRQKLMQQGQ